MTVLVYGETKATTCVATTELNFVIEYNQTKMREVQKFLDDYNFKVAVMDNNIIIIIIIIIKLQKQCDNDVH